MQELSTRIAIDPFVRTLTREWPFWFHFLEKDGDSMAVLLRLLIDVNVVRHGRESVGVTIADLKQSTRVLHQLFDGMNVLYSMHDYSEQENIDMTTEVFQCMDRCF